MNKSLTQFTESRLSKKAMRLIKGGSDTIEIMLPMITVTVETEQNYDSLFDALTSESGEDANYFSNKGWCCQNLQGITWVYHTTDAMLNAISGNTGPTGQNIQCTQGTYCP
jgi:predicted 3-demethylubiquinone-9 3-methyltransferase (glyoxalase superfamily)